MVQKISNQPIK